MARVLSSKSMLLPSVNWRALVPALKGGVLASALVLLALVIGARPQELPPSANELVRHIVTNELKPDPAHFMYRATRERADGGTETKQMVETRDGIFARFIAINGKPLTQAQRDKEDKRLQRLINDSGALASKRKEQKDDEARIRRMVGALPDAFTYEYAATEHGLRGELVTLKFSPNPQYDPPNREVQVYTGMEGTMVIDIAAGRIARIDGTLFRDVNFGWGILGKLDKGGKFIVEQGEVVAGHWEPTRMVLNFTGKVLIFKSLKIKSIDTTTDYRRVPDDLTVAQALNMLKKAEGMVAENTGQ